MADGSTMRAKIWACVAPRHSAALTRAHGVAITPWIALISTMKNVPQKIRKYFDVSPMPNQITAMGIMAVGERKRKNSITGSSRSCTTRIRPMRTPRTMPRVLPSANPTATRVRLAAM